jgi:DNA polymerase I-like protein with 3'-5' exonuclease and polymerase domains
MKPAKCLRCPLYSKTMIAPIGETTSASLVFLLESPPSFASYSLAGNEGKILKEVLGKAGAGDPKGLTAKSINSALYMYAVCCASMEPTSVKIANQCRDSVGAQQILNSGAKVVVAFGAKAMSFFGLKSHKESRGSAQEVNFFGKNIQVITTFSLANLLSKPGLAFLMVKDIQKAGTLASGGVEVELDVPALMAGYDIPTSLEAAKGIADEYCAYARDKGTPANTLMALDFETNTLYPYWDKSRVIAISGAVEPGKAFSLYVDHKDSPYSFVDIIPWVWKILQSPHPKTWWNYKFDYGMAKYTLVRQTREAMVEFPELGGIIEGVVGKPIDALENDPVHNTRWDGTLGEHMLDENKKGYYSLKQVVLNHFPSLAGYERPLHTQLSDLNNAHSSRRLTQMLTAPSSDLQGLSPIGHTGDIREEVEKIKEYSTSLRVKKKKKGCDPALKLAIENTLLILTSRVKHIKKIVKACTTIVSREDRLLIKNPFNNPHYSAATFEDVDVGVMMPYAAIDADLTLRISQDQRKRAWAEDPKSVAVGAGRECMLSLMDKHYIPMSTILSTMQVEGIRVDIAYLQDEYTRLQDREIALETSLLLQISTDLGRDPDSIILNNPVELANLMIAGYGLPVVKVTKKDNNSSDSEALEVWGKINPVAYRIQEYRNTLKARTTFISNFIAFSDYDEWIHGSFWLNGTATGRLSSSDPALQILPVRLAGTEIKRAFVSTDTSDSRTAQDTLLMGRYGWEANEELCIVDLDFAGAEVRGLTVYAQDPALLEALNSGLDMHSWVASIVFEEDYDRIIAAREVDKALQSPEEKALVVKRQQAKAVVFGMMFCISAPKLAADLQISVGEADALMSMFFKRFPKIKEYIDTTKHRVIRENILRTPTGRARRFPLAAMGGSTGAACGRQGVNFLVQGFTSEIVCRVLINLSKHIGEVRGRILMTVHDSIVFEMPRKLLPTLEGFLSLRVEDFIVTTFPMVPVNLPYDVEVGPSYGEAKHSIEAYTQNIE